MEVALVRRAVAEHRDRDPALALGGERRAGGGGDAAADDAEAADEAVLDVDHVHRARPPAAHAGGAAEHLGDQRVGVGALGERVAVAAVGAGEVVAGLERRAHADRHGLLAGAQVRGAVDLALEEQPLHLGLEQADQQHPPVALEVRRRRLGVDRGARRDPMSRRALQPVGHGRRLGLELEPRRLGLRARSARRSRHRCSRCRSAPGRPAARPTPPASARRARAPPRVRARSP